MSAIANAMNTAAGNHSVVFIGGGKMGGAMALGLARTDNQSVITIVEQNETVRASLAATFANFPNVQIFSDIESASANIRKANEVVLATKPQDYEAACASLKPSLQKNAAVVSIMAGITIASLESQFGADQPIVRSMPNLPASIGKGMTVAVANDKVSAPQQELCGSLLAASGKSGWVQDESLMNAVTGVSGSGPAWVFHYVEALATVKEDKGMPQSEALAFAKTQVFEFAKTIQTNMDKGARAFAPVDEDQMNLYRYIDSWIKAGVEEGLPQDLVETMVDQTFVGAAGLMQASPEIPPSTLRANVTSKGGTTAAGLASLMDQHTGLQSIILKYTGKTKKADESWLNIFDSVMSSTIHAATERGRELGAQPAPTVPAEPSAST